MCASTATRTVGLGNAPLEQVPRGHVLVAVHDLYVGRVSQALWKGGLIINSSKKAQSAGHVWWNSLTGEFFDEGGLAHALLAHDADVPVDGVVLDHARDQVVVVRGQDKAPGTLFEANVLAHRRCYIDGLSCREAERRIILLRIGNPPPAFGCWRGTSELVPELELSRSWGIRGPHAHKFVTFVVVDGRRRRRNLRL